MELERIYKKKILNEISHPYVSILIGPRQVGKSYLLKQIQKECREKKYTTAYYNLEFPDDLLKFSGEDGNIIKSLNTGPDVIFIDEFHYIKNATKIFKSIYDTGKGKKIIASGSSSIEIHRHLKESLTGRFRITDIYPLTLHELRGLKRYDMNDYFIMGGMPGLIHEKTFDEKIELLKNIVHAYLMKDIKSLIKEENIRAFNHLLYAIAQSQGSVATVSNFSREVRLSEPAVSNHLNILEETKVCFPLLSYSGNLANELKKSKKYYLYDPGIRNSILGDFSKIDARPDRGALLETVVFLAFKRKLKPNMDIRFWRTRQGDEVDFVLLKNRIPCPVEVKYQVQPNEIPRGLKKFMSIYKNAGTGIVVSTNFSGEVTFNGRMIKFIQWHEAENMEYFQNE